jgi:hypothetical protein
LIGAALRRTARASPVHALGSKPLLIDMNPLPFCLVCRFRPRPKAGGADWHAPCEIIEPLPDDCAGAPSFVGTAVVFGPLAFLTSP